MSDLISEPIQEPPDVPNRGPTSSLEGVSDGLGSCLESAKPSIAVDLSQAMSSSITPDLEQARSEQDALRSDDGGTIVDCLVRKGMIVTTRLGSVKGRSADNFEGVLCGMRIAECGISKRCILRNFTCGNHGSHGQRKAGILNKSGKVTEKSEKVTEFDIPKSEKNQRVRESQGKSKYQGAKGNKDAEKN